jgi:hypothetical protein
MKLYKYNLNTENIIHFAIHLLEARLYYKPYKIEEEPSYAPDSEDNWRIVEPYFEYPILELPFIWEEWYESKEDNTILWVFDEDRTMPSSLHAFFGINEEIFIHLFIPGRQKIEKFGGKMLTNSSSHIEIAMNMFELVHKYNSDSIIKHNSITLN